MQRKNSLLGEGAATLGKDNRLLHSVIPVFIHSLTLAPYLLPRPHKHPPVTSHRSQGLREPTLSDPMLLRMSLSICMPLPSTYNWDQGKAPPSQQTPSYPPPLHDGAYSLRDKLMKQHHLPHELAGQIISGKIGEHFPFSKKKKKDFKMKSRVLSTRSKMKSNVKA